MQLPTTRLTALVCTVFALAGCNPSGPQAPSTQPLRLSEAAIQNGLPAVVRPDAMKSDLFFLTSDRLEGRGVGTDGLDIAADFVAARFASLGLAPVPGLDGYFQHLEMTTATNVGKETSLASGNKNYTAKEQFTVLPLSAEKDFSGPAVFAGYGIVWKEKQYDDYAGIDVKGKVVLVMRFEPHDKAGKSAWAGNDNTTHSHLETKVKQAAEHGALAIILVNPAEHRDTENDSLLPFSRVAGTPSTIPVMQIKRTLADEWLKRGGAPSLAELQKKIDGPARPASVELKGVTLQGKASIDRTKKKVRNVVAMIPGSGPTAGEYVIVGAHYDHLGWGGPGSLMNLPLLQRQPGVTEPGNPHAPASHPSSQPATQPITQPATMPRTQPSRAIHKGADDNGSGTVALLELARLFAQRSTPPDRTLIFVSFTGEEAGLVGSNYFVRNPPVDLKRAAAMLNLDMVGRVRKNLLYVGGGGTAAPFDAILKKADADSVLEFKNFGKGGLGPSDHMSFAQKKVPVIFFFTGTHEDYHRPTDTADKINYQGMAQVVQLSIGVIDEVTRMPLSKYNDAADKDSMRTPQIAGEPGGRRASLGIIPDYGQGEDESGKGVLISGTMGGSAAAKAGLQAGDIILKLGDKPTTTLMELSNVIATLKPGDKVKLTYKRADKTLTADVTMGQRGG